MPVTVLWKVKTFGTFPIQPGESILSSRFYVDNSREVEFCLRILGEFPSSDEVQVGNLFLCRCDNDGPEKVEVEYKTTLGGKENASIYKKQFLKPQHDVLYWCSETDSVPIMKEALSDGTLMVGCIILSYENVSCVDCEPRDEDDFVNLSQAFTALLDSSLFSDAVIRIPNKEFKVHKAVLELRCPEMLTECQTDKVQRTYSEYSEHTIEFLLYYIYTGKLKSESIPDEFYFLVKQSNNSLFNHLFVTCPYLTYMHTSFDVKDIKFHWVIEDFLDFSQDKEYCHKIRDGDPFTWFKLTFCTFQQKGKTKRLEFMMHKMFKTTAAFVSCIIEVFGCKSVRKTVFEGNHLFTDEQPWKVQLRDYEINVIRARKRFKVVEFYVQLKVASGDLVTSVKCKFLPTPCQNASTKLYHLGQDMGKLYENPKHSDIILNIKNKKIPAHKAILSARSSVFRRKLQKNRSQRKTAEVVINDLNEKVALSMIYYIYSAQVVDLDVDLAFELYKAADLYKIFQLKRKCSKFLEFSLDVKNVAEILLFADAQNDQDLKSFAYDFINSNPTRVLESKRLIDIIKRSGYLHVERLKEILENTM